MELKCIWNRIGAHTIKSESNYLSVLEYLRLYILLVVLFIVIWKEKIINFEISCE